MNDSDVERRRQPRGSVTDAYTLAVKAAMPVQILDVSRGGVLLGSRTALAVGDRAELQATIGSESFSVVIEIRHVSIETEARGGNRYRAGAVFVTGHPEQRALLERLFGAEPR